MDSSRDGFEDASNHAESSSSNAVQSSSTGAPCSDEQSGSALGHKASATRSVASVQQRSTYASRRQERVLREQQRRQKLRQRGNATPCERLVAFVVVFIVLGVLSVELRYFAVRSMQGGSADVDNNTDAVSMTGNECSDASGETCKSPIAPNVAANLNAGDTETRGSVPLA
eukprot:TRINITY_DN32846_c0_g1_i1.p1 TRINITY_DN32846_c0_g1~~TRINITY_DN32846_c0_g1_i1.p1  ORF type:complete len:171 (-),score=11.80 TRINITY_DN32846_c0_g1_i1:335-847(-)